jgi:hypothetical protein
MSDIVDFKFVPWGNGRIEISGTEYNTTAALSSLLEQVATHIHSPRRRWIWADAGRAALVGRRTGPTACSASRASTSSASMAAPSAAATPTRAASRSPCPLERPPELEARTRAQHAALRFRARTAPCARRTSDSGAMLRAGHHPESRHPRPRPPAADTIPDGPSYDTRRRRQPPCAHARRRRARGWAGWGSPCTRARRTVDYGAFDPYTFNLQSVYNSMRWGSTCTRARRTEQAGI